MKATILTSLLLLISCGRKVGRFTEYNSNSTTIENKYDDSKLQAYNLIQDARIEALELRASHLEAVSSELADDIEKVKRDIEEEFDLTNDYLNDLQLEVRTSKVEVIKICASSENLIKVGGAFYAVYMISNNYGTYLGKLENNTNYQTTDNSHKGFHLTNGSIVCH